MHFCRAQVTGQSVLVSLLPTSPAPHLCCPLTPPLPALGLDLHEWAPSASSSPPQGLYVCYAFHLELPFYPGLPSDHTSPPQNVLPVCRPECPLSPLPLPDAFCFLNFPPPQSYIFTCLLMCYLLPQGPAGSPTPGTHSRCLVNNSELT